MLIIDDVAENAKRHGVGKAFSSYRRNSSAPNLVVEAVVRCAVEEELPVVPPG